MNRKTLLIFGIIFVAGIVFFRSTASSDDVSVVSKTSSEMVDESWYIDYSSQALDEAIVSEQKTLIFIYADWCSTCRAASKDFQFNQDQIPSDITILKADYDTESELKKKYDITVQHTFVLLDEEGEVLNKWVGGGLETLLMQLRKI